ncbi:MAG: pyridoxal-phosphate dependent enzyme [bacterium]
MNVPLHIVTPLIQSARLSQPDARIWLKMEALQPAGSFKNRGIGHACQHYISQGAKRLISSSGGNAGIATAYSGQKLGVPVIVIVPESTSTEATDAMRMFGAAVTVHGHSWLEAHQHAESLLDQTSVLIHPFDDPLLWPGHATMIDEVLAADCAPDAVVLSVGGGGLLSGVAQGLKNHNLEDTLIVAVETEGAASLAAAMEADELVMLDQISTIANTLGAKQVCANALDVVHSMNVYSHIVSDQQALTACKHFLNDHRILVEPACGAALAAIYDDSAILKDAREILVVVCGGMGVSIAQLERWQQQLDRQNG